MQTHHNEIKTVTFFGSSLSLPGDKNFEDAKAVAKAIATSGRTIINGGGPGVMLAATEGAKEAGGKTTVVYYRPELASDFVSEVAANIADESYEEANYIDRTQRLLELGDAYIVFNGGTGTISEFAMAWGVARLYIDHHKPLLLFGDFWEHLMEDFAEHMMIRPEEKMAYTIVHTVEETMNAIERYETILQKAHHKHEECKGPECHLFLS